ncbi:MAG: cell division ATP-binding protein FtsE [Gemmatimonadaceae bacterium]
MSLVRFLNVAKEYSRGGVALNHVSFQLHKSEFVFLTGPSGAGKSTILKMMYMDERPTAGDVWVSGVSAREARRRDISKMRRHLGIVFQDFRLLEDRTAEANVAFALEVTGAPRDTIRSKVSRALTQVGLAAKGTAYPRELSGGEQQRVAIARALVNDPFIVIADEPTGNLDERATRGVFQLLRDINAAGTAVVMATHDLDLIRRTEYRTIELNHGRIVFDSAESPTPKPAPDSGPNSAPTQESGREADLPLSGHHMVEFDDL